MSVVRFLYIVEGPNDPFNPTLHKMYYIQQEIKRKGASIGGATGTAGPAIAIPLFRTNLFQN